MLRSAATAGASPADAETNANAAVLTHSDVLIPTLNATHPALAKTDRLPPAGGPSKRSAVEQIPGRCGASATDPHSRRLFSQSSRYLRAITRSLSLACA